MDLDCSRAFLLQNNFRSGGALFLDPLDVAGRSTTASALGCSGASMVCVIGPVRNALLRASLVGIELERMSDVTGWAWDE